jgi:hypothetical protein
MKEKPSEVKDEITSAGVELAVINFFEGVNLKSPGRYSKGDKYIEVVRDRKEKVLSATAIVNGVIRAVVKNNYGSTSTTYFRLQGEEDANGIRDDVVYNKGVFGEEAIKLYRGPGVDLSKKKLADSQDERLGIANRLGIKLNVPSRRIHVLK